MMGNIIKFLLFLLFLVGITLTSFWIAFPDYPFEPAIVLVTLLITAIEFIRRKNVSNKLNSESENINLYTIPCENKQPTVSKHQPINMTSDENDKLEDIGVRHIIPNEESWKVGLVGFFLQVKGRTIILIFFLVLSIIIFTLTDDKSSLLKLIDIPNSYIAISFLTILFSAFLLLSIYIKHRSIRSLKIKSHLHQLFHESREEVCAVFKRTSKYNDIDHEEVHLKDFSNKTCNIIKNYFKIISGDETVSCAIRLVSEMPNNDGVGYVTIGRSNNLNHNRGDSSEPIKRCEGIPNFFSNLTAPNKGLLFYHNIDLATQYDAYKKTRNDILYKSDIKYIIVAPINGWNGDKNDLIGLLYINSKTPAILNIRNADLVAFTADSLSIIYTILLERLHKFNKPTYHTNTQENCSNV